MFEVFEAGQKEKKGGCGETSSGPRKTQWLRALDLSLGKGKQSIRIFC